MNDVLSCTPPVPGAIPRRSDADQSIAEKITDTWRTAPGMTATRVGVALPRGPHHLKLLGTPIAATCERPLRAARSRCGRITSTLRSPRRNRITGMWLASANHRIPHRSARTPGVTRSACPDAHAGNTPPARRLQLCTKPDKYSRTRHNRSNTVCTSSTSLTVTTPELADRGTLVTSPQRCLRSRE